MSNKGKYIGINQRIPFEVLDSAIHYYLEHSAIDREFVFGRMLEFTKGANRASKATSYVIQIMSRQKKIIDAFRSALSNISYADLRTDDRKVFQLCLICLTYPITYELLVSLAQGFKAQNQINKLFISEKVKSIYGSNRTVDIAIDALLPMIIELSALKRDKISLYSAGERLIVANGFLFELIVYTDIKLSGTKKMMLSEIKHRPWFYFFQLNNVSSTNFITLLSMNDSSVGTSYISLR
jgi:hypothetical protein